MLSEDLPLYSTEAKRALKLLGLTITKKGREFLREHAPEIQAPKQPGGHREETVGAFENFLKEI